MGRRNISSNSRNINSFLKKILVISFLTFSLTARFLFSSHCKPLRSLPPPSQCVRTWRHLRALAGTEISGSLVIRSWSESGYLLIGVPDHSGPQEPREQLKIVFLQQKSIFEKPQQDSIPKHVSAIACTHIHTHATMD